MPRKTTYKKEYGEQARKLCFLGAIDKDLADFFGVNVLTINRWKKKYKGFKKALDEGKSIADARVVKSLYLRATGYDHIDTHFASYEGEIISEEYTKHWPPDVTACIFWLKNRQPDKWRDVQQYEGELTININETHKGKKIGNKP